MKLFQPNIIYIEKTVSDHPVTRTILEKFPDVESQSIGQHQELVFDELTLNARIKKEKQGLILARKNGELVKQVQRDLFREISNEYYIIHSLGCPFDCQYCFLYDYLQHQMPTIFVNLDEILDSVRSVIESQPEQELVFHAGEFSDALAYDHITDLSRPLVELFAGYNKAYLELRTKSNNINNLLGLVHHQRTIVSWTFSPQRVVQLMEYHTASCAERIAAARTCQQAGYPVAIRLDPIVCYPGWQGAYRQLIAELAANLDPMLVHDCQLGVFRYTPGLAKVIRERFPGSWLRLGESVPGRDGKYRYLKTIRIEMYEKIIAWLRDAFPALKMELCMESPEVQDALQEQAHDV